MNKVTEYTFWGVTGYCFGAFLTQIFTGRFLSAGILLLAYIGGFLVGYTLKIVYYMVRQR